MGNPGKNGGRLSRRGRALSQRAWRRSQTRFPRKFVGNNRDSTHRTSSHLLTEKFPSLAPLPALRPAKSWVCVRTLPIPQSNFVYINLGWHYSQIIPVLALFQDPARHTHQVRRELESLMGIAMARLFPPPILYIRAYEYAQLREWKWEGANATHMNGLSYFQI